MTPHEQREAVSAAAMLSCPVCWAALARTDDSERSLHHGRVCLVCGVVVLFPRVALVRALGRFRKAAHR